MSAKDNIEYQEPWNEDELTQIPFGFEPLLVTGFTNREIIFSANISIFTIFFLRLAQACASLCKLKKLKSSWVNQLGLNFDKFYDFYF